MQTIFWFRRDFRLSDNTGLYHALMENKEVKCIFIFDTNILHQLEDKTDARVSFIHQELTRLNEELSSIGSRLEVFHGTPTDILTTLLTTHKTRAIYCNHDYEPAAIERDNTIATLAKEKNVDFKSYKDQVIFEKDAIVKNDGTSYAVFTPYSKRWKEKLLTTNIDSFPTEKYLKNLKKEAAKDILPLKTIGFQNSKQQFPATNLSKDILLSYHKTRDFPAIKGTSEMSIHLRFGTVSIRQLVQKALNTNETYLNELIWREFYMMLLWHHPKVANYAYKAKYDTIPWRNNEEEFSIWCQGKTGFPIIDAGMRQLNQTGFMHNRVRMIVASFLVKNLLIDWRWGEAYFAQKLLDYDLAANNGGWQWAAGSGCDAAPYFRIFNPVSQQKKFDPEGLYVKKWVPELDDPFQYPKPMVDLKISRERALKTYKKALKQV